LFIRGKLVKEIIVFRYASQIIVVTVEKKPIMRIPNQVLNRAPMIEVSENNEC